jgi:glycosyltransferase domain-containing protein
MESLVSIGIPCYNRPIELRRALESVVRQTYSNLEIIVSDNGSPDPEVERVVRSFMGQYPHIRYFKHEENKGPTFNFTFVLQQAQGEYFMWLGDDDWLDASYISDCVWELVNHPDYSLVCGKSCYFIHDTFTYEGVMLNLLEESEEKRVLNYYVRVCDNGTFYGVMRRNQVLRVPFWNVIGSDWLIIATMAFLGKIKTLDTTQVYRTKRAMSTQEYHHQIASTAGLSRFQAHHPHLTLAGVNFWAVLFRFPVYRTQTFSERLALAYQSSKTIINNHVICPYPIQIAIRWKKQCMVFIKKYITSLSELYRR